MIVKQKDLNCNANKVNIMEQSLATANDAKARSFWKALGGKAEVAGLCGQAVKDRLLEVL